MEALINSILQTLKTQFCSGELLGRFAWADSQAETQLFGKQRKAWKGPVDIQPSAILSRDQPGAMG